MIDADAIAAAQYFTSRYGSRALMLTRNIADSHRSTENEHAPFWHQVARRPTARSMKTGVAADRALT